MMAYWDWWVGALALGLVTFFYHQLVGRRFGVSGAWERVVHWDIERRVERENRGLIADADAFEQALRDATEAQFGGDTLIAAKSEAESSDGAGSNGPMPMTANLLLLAAILVGAAVAALVNGRFEVRGDMGPAFADIVVDGPMMWPVLFVGGVLVGIGTRMAGGCSSGHGMSGCSRLQPVSIVATSFFFGTAVVVSSLLRWVI